MTDQSTDTPFPLPACGECNGAETTEGVTEVTLRRSCPVHGGLTKWLASNADPEVVERVAEAATSHERAAAAWAEATTSIADFFENVAKKIRPDKP
jgi:hypothetical protein